MMRWSFCFAALAVACSSSPENPNDGGGTDASLGDAPTADAPTTNEAGTDAPITTDGSAPTGQWVLGYYVGYDINAYPIASIDWSGLTHVAFAPLTVKNDLTLDLSFSDQNGTGQADATALSTAAHAHNVKALLMLGGAGAGGNIATAASSANRAAFVTKLVNVLGRSATTASISTGKTA